MSSATQLGSSAGQQTIPATMQAAVYRGVNDVRMETVPVPKIGAGRDTGSRSHLRHLRDRSEEDCHRFSLRPADFWP